MDVTRDHLRAALTAGQRLSGVPQGAQSARTRRAAVLCPVIERPGSPTILLTRRSQHLPTHAGQISFPGGKIDPGDPSPLDAALREAEEEIGLRPADVEIAGALDLYDTSTGFLVTPFVGLVSPSFRPVAEPGEVDEIFEVPLAFIADAANHRHVEVTHDGRRRAYYEITYHHYRIWGATAGMLRDLCERLWALDTNLEIPAASKDERLNGNEAS